VVVGLRAPRVGRHAPLLGCVLLIVVGHLLIGSRYGVHRDEMYFVACGRQLAAGYVDHPPLVPAVARGACSVGGCGTGSLRLPSLVARVAAVVLTILLVRTLGGGPFAQTMAGLAVVFAPAYLRMGKILCLPVFEPVFWTAGALLLVRLARDEAGRHWLVLGLVVGVGTLNKHTMSIWALGAAIASLTVPRLRAQLRTAWPWLGLGVAVVAMVPNVLWQWQHNYATLEFLRTIRSGMLAEIPRSLFVAGQLLYMHPFSALLWLPGLWLCLVRPGGEGATRAFGIIFLVGFGAFLVTRGKPYYLAAAYPPLFAAGAIGWERRLKRWSSRGVLVGAQVTTGVAMAVLTLPVLSLPRMDAVVGAMFGRVVPPIALTHDLHDEYGWGALAESVAAVWRELPPDEQARTEIVTGNYGEAAAIDYFGPVLGLPRAASGHMNYFLWGPTKPDADMVLAVGLRPDWLARSCGRLEERGGADHPLAAPSERRVPLVLCRDLAKPLGNLWPELKRYDNSADRPRAPTDVDQPP
jgi:hypothetical protein